MQFLKKINLKKKKAFLCLCILSPSVPVTDSVTKRDAVEDTSPPAASQAQRCSLEAAVTECAPAACPQLGMQQSRRATLTTADRWDVVSAEPLVLSL